MSQPQIESSNARSAHPDPGGGDGLLRQARVSPDQHARYQRRSGDQRRADLSLFRKQGSGDFGDGRPAQEGDSPKCSNARGRRRRLLESLEILFTAHCCEDSPQVVSAFVVDLYAEASRNPQVADLVRDVLQTAMDGVTDLIARSPEGAKCSRTDLTPDELAELIFAVARGMLMRDVLQPQEMTAAERRDAATGSDAQTLALVVQTGGRTRLCMTWPNRDFKCPVKSNARRDVAGGRFASRCVVGVIRFRSLASRRCKSAR